MQKTLMMVSLGLSLATMTTTASAHGIWLSQRLDKTQIVLGEGPFDNSYSPSCVKQVTSYNRLWHAVNVTVDNQVNFVTVTPANDSAVIAIAFDYGFWSKSTLGRFVNLPMDKVAGATTGTHAIKYNVSYLSRVTTLKPVPHIPLQIMPLINPTELKRGETLPVQVLKDGKPLAQVPVIIDVVNNLDVTTQTDGNGIANIRIPNQGNNVIGIEIGFPLSGSLHATQTKYFSTLSFTLQPEEE